MSLIKDENRWMEEQGRDMESGLSQVPAPCDCWAVPPAVTPAALDNAGEQEDWHDYVNTQDGMYVSVEEAEQRESVLREALTAMHDVLVARFWLQEPDDCMKYVSRVNWSLLKENARTALRVPNAKAEAAK